MLGVSVNTEGLFEGLEGVLAAAGVVFIQGLIYG